VTKGSAWCLTAGLAAAALLGVACSWTTTRPALETEPPSSPTITDPSAHLPLDPPTAASKTARLPGTPRVLIQDVIGATSDQVEAIFAEVTKEIERCKLRTSGVVRVRVKASDGDVKTSLQSTSNDAAVDQCVLTAVALNVDSALEPSTSPSETSPDLESVLTISW
jgi:hypothetical protein